MKKDWYMEALEDTLSEQQFEIDELEAQIAYLESGGNSPELLAECKQELAQAIEDYESAKKYVDSQRKYSA